MYQRLAAVYKATGNFKALSKKKVKNSLSKRNVTGNSSVHKAPNSSKFSFYQTELDISDGTFSLLSIEGETVTIILPIGPKNFRSTILKRFIHENGDKTKNQKEYIPYIQVKASLYSFLEYEDILDAPIVYRTHDNTIKAYS